MKRADSTQPMAELAVVLMTLVLVAGAGAVAPAHAAAATFPTWAQTAGVAGVAFDPDESWAHAEDHVDHLVGQGVSAVVADSPLGWSYEAWVDDAEFDRNVDLIHRVTSYAHSKGLRVVWYVTGLELISEGGARNPAAEHPTWPQVSIKGTPVAFRDISTGQEHWLNTGDWDVWMSPDEPTLRELYFRRVRELAGTGVDGLWVDTVYLQDSIGRHESMWPSYDTASASSFKTATGLDPPAGEDWDSIIWKRWLRWRHDQLKRFLVDIKAQAQTVNPNLFVFEENWAADTGGAVTYGNDPLAYLDQPDLSTGHEISSIGDRMDLGETGMAAATVTNWRDFAAMVKFARGADGAKPSWILTYGYRVPDAMRQAGVIAAAGANYYETNGPGMDGTVGAHYRHVVFDWTKRWAKYLFGLRRRARVALLYSGVSRDLVDGGSGEYYDTADSIFFRQYRLAARALIAHHVSFDTVPDSSLAAGSLARYGWVVEPAPAVSDTQAAVLADYAAAGGRLVTRPGAGVYDEWAHDRTTNAFSAVARRSWTSFLAAESNNDRYLGPATYLETGWAGDWQRAVVVNFSRVTRYDVPLTLRTPAGRRPLIAYATAPGQAQQRLRVSQSGSRTWVRIPRLAAFVLVRVRYSPAETHVTVIQPGPGDGQDAGIQSSSDPGWNLGASPAFGVAGGPYLHYRGLLRFDLSAVPPDKAITGATLWLYNTDSSGPGDMNACAYRVTAPWNEGTYDQQANDAAGDGVTWFERRYGDGLGDGNTPFDESDPDWSSDGGDFSGADGDRSDVNTDPGYPYRKWVGLTGLGPLVGKWYRGEVPNYGVLVKSTAEGLNEARVFATSDYPDSDKHPRLVITWED